MATDCKYLKRDSNMELLRLVAMLSVILFHLDFLGMGIELHVIEASPLSTILGVLGLKSLTMSCVNLFVLVSGWYSTPRVMLTSTVTVVTSIPFTAAQYVFTSITY